MYRIETHLHTKYASHCGRMDEKELISAYKAAGFQGIIVTDHFNRETFAMYREKGISFSDPVVQFLEGYRRMAQEGARQGIRVYKGAELRFDECMNDYLLYGFPDALLADPDAVFSMGVAAFSPLCRASGALLIQAHPYRHHCTPAIACYLDGVEIRNGNPRHNSHNGRAEAYAREFGLIATAGSDCHQPEDVARTGILMPRLPQDEAALVRMLRQGDFRRMGIRRD